ncbi:hypothetical protein ACA910_001637 [Epithemia clementina (nom. ined.)]
MKVPTPQQHTGGWLRRSAFVLVCLALSRVYVGSDAFPVQVVPQQPTNHGRLPSGKRGQSMVVGKVGVAALSSSAQNDFESKSSSAVLEDYGNIRDSWSLVVLGDLHLEDDMTAHLQARQDLLDAMQALSIWLSPPETKDRNHQQQSVAVDQMKTVKDVIEGIQQARAGDLSVDQLEILLAYKKATTPPGGGGGLLQTFLVSLGDLGRKDIRHEPGDAGTTKSFLDAKEFLDGFGMPYDVVSGNHDLEGLDEFDTDAANLQAWMDCFQKPTPQFCRYVGEKTVLLGLSTVRFRDSPHSSHEVHIDDAQLDWFVQTVQAHPASEGWKILVFSHAPITGSKLRVLQNVHVTNGCAWLNHCSDESRRNLFIRTVQENPQIKLWCSGHFHLSQDFNDSLSTVGSCTFMQVGVIGPASTRDGKRQTRLVRGCRNRLQIYTVSHHEVPRGAHDGDEEKTSLFATTKYSDKSSSKSSSSLPSWIRLDADIDLETGEVVTPIVEEKEDEENVNGAKKDWFQAYTPREEDGCYIETANNDGSLFTTLLQGDDTDSIVCWWHMKDGRVLGLHQGQLVEYDAETLSPLGIVLNHNDLKSRRSSVSSSSSSTANSKQGQKQVVVVENGTVLALIDESALDDSQRIQVVHPNDDGSYWRKYQRNKRIRQEEKAREALAKTWLLQQKEQQTKQM